MRTFACLAVVLALNYGAACKDESFDLGRRFLNAFEVNGSGTVLVGKAVAVDPGAHFYVGGHFKDSARFGTNVFTSRHSFDAYLSKYDREKNFIWVIRVQNAVAYATAVYGTEAVFLAGYVGGDTLFVNTPFQCLGRGDAFLAKLDHAGHLLWVKQAGSRRDVARAADVAVDAAGNSYIAGAFGREAIFDDVTLRAQEYGDLFLAKYDPNGHLLWAKRDGGASAQPGGIAVDQAGNVFVTGILHGPAQFGTETLSSVEGRDMFLVKYDTDGRFLWGRAPGGAPDRMGLNLAVDGQGNPHVVGHFKGTLQFGSTNMVIVEPKHHSNVFLAKYDGDGGFHWVRQFRKGDFDFSNVLSVEAQGVNLTAHRGTNAPSVARSTVASETKAEALKTALSVRGGATPATVPQLGPVLRMRKSGEFIILFWPKEFASFELERSETLTPFPVWEPVSQRAEVMGDHLVVSIPIHGALKFYRLRNGVTILE